MLIEHIARGQYIINFTDGEWRELKEVATGFHLGNLCTTIRNIFEGGLRVYKDLLAEGYSHDINRERIVKLLAADLVEPEDVTEPNTKFGSAIQSDD